MDNERTWKEDVMAKCEISSMRVTQWTGKNDYKNTGSPLSLPGFELVTCCTKFRNVTSR